MIIPLTVPYVQRYQLAREVRHKTLDAGNRNAKCGETDLKNDVQRAAQQYSGCVMLPPLRTPKRHGPCVMQSAHQTSSPSAPTSAMHTSSAQPIACGRARSYDEVGIDDPPSTHLAAGSKANPRFPA